LATFAKQVTGEFASVTPTFLFGCALGVSPDLLTPKIVLVAEVATTIETFDS
jgi:hypothetical protein